MSLNDDHQKDYLAILKKLQGVKSWRDRARICYPRVSLHPPVLPGALAEAEDKLGITLPEELKEIYAESDGVFMNTGANTIMPLEDMIAENLDLRDRDQYEDLYMPFDNLLFFGRAGNGDLWAFGIKANGKIDTLNLYGWDHETDARPWIARDIFDLFVRIGCGSLYDAST